MNRKSAVVVGLALVTGLVTASGVQAQIKLPERPEPGTLQMYDLRLQRSESGYALRANIMAVDQGEAAHESEVWLQAEGDGPVGNRTLSVNRLDRDCIAVAKQSVLSATEFCDRLSVTEKREQAEVEFTSYDADRRYGFDLFYTGNGKWQSRARSSMAEPELALSVVGDQYFWTLQGSRQRHQQTGSIDRAIQREIGYSDLEWSAIGLAEVLRDFNSEEFRYSTLPRDHPDYQFSPYLAWGGGEEGLDGGCIFIVCFGNLGGDGSGGGSSSGGMCDPESENYQPEHCPADLSYATWPISQRAKIWKVDNDRFGFSLFIKNVGTGNYYRPLMNIGDDAFSALLHVTLTPNVQPLVPKDNLSRYDYKCFYQKSVSTLPNDNPWSNDPLLPPGGTIGVTREVACPKSSGRPNDWYQLWFQVDPWNQGYDPGPSTNNSGDSGPLDWIRLH